MQIKTEVHIFDQIENKSTTVALYHSTQDSYSTDLHLYESVKTESDIKVKTDLVTLTNTEFVDLLDAISTKEEIRYKTSFNNDEVLTDYSLSETKEVGSVYHCESLSLTVGHNTYVFNDDDLNKLCKFAGNLLSILQESITN